MKVTYYELLVVMVKFFYDVLVAIFEEKETAFVHAGLVICDGMERETVYGAMKPIFFLLVMESVLPW